MDDRRRQPRQRTLLGGRVAYNNQSTMDGTLRNISDGGALIIFSAPTAVPLDLVLTIPSRSEMRRAHVVWSGNDRAGLALEPKSVRVSLVHEQRLRAVERKNREIRRRIASASY